MDGDNQNFALGLRNNANLFPDKKALIFPKKNTGKMNAELEFYTFKQVEQDSDSLAWGLSKIGMKPEMKTILMVKPGYELYVTIFALIKLGVVPVIVDPGMGISRMLHCYQSVKPEGFIGIPLANLLKCIEL